MQTHCLKPFVRITVLALHVLVTPITLDTVRYNGFKLQLIVQAAARDLIISVQSDLNSVGESISVRCGAWDVMISNGRDELGNVLMISNRSPLAYHITRELALLPVASRGQFSSSAFFFFLWRCSTGMKKCYG